MSNQTSELIKLNKEDAVTTILQIVSEDADDAQVGMINLMNMDHTDNDTKAWVSYIIWVVKGYPIHVKENGDVQKYNIITALKKVLDKAQQKRLGELCFDYYITKSSSDDDIASEMTGEWLQKRMVQADNPTEIQMEYLTAFFGKIMEECIKSDYAPKNAAIEIKLK